MITIRKVMNERVAAVNTGMTVGETVDVLTQNHIGGAPVIGDDGELVGMVSELALIDVVFDAAVQHAPITRYMTTEVQFVTPNESLKRAAQLFALYAFRRLPVVDDGKLIGILSRRDLMNYALRTGEVLLDPLIELIPSLSAAHC